jgi:hypothetical protein
MVEAGAFRPITATSFKRPERGPAPGPAPVLQWIDIAALVVDQRYQRVISKVGAANVARIAADFSWAHFSPVIVAPVEGGRFAIIDGQHRATAAALIGMTSVPCAIVIASEPDQARAFAAINGNQTRVHGQKLFQARVVAGEPEAQAIARVAARAGVTILPYPVPADRQGLGETNSWEAIGALIKAHGEARAALVLQALRTGANDRPGAVIRPAMLGMAKALARLSPDAGDEAALLDEMARIDLFRLHGKAVDRARERGEQAGNVMAEMIVAAIGKLRLARQGRAA